MSIYTNMCLTHIYMQILITFSVEDKLEKNDYFEENMRFLNNLFRLVSS